jgi:hypothetical protein
MTDFRKADPHSGELRVASGSRTSRGAHGLTGQASCDSPRVLAGSDAKCEAAAGESAQTSTAHAASRNMDAEPAKPETLETEGAPEKTQETKPSARKGKGSSKKGTNRHSKSEDPQDDLWRERMQLDGGDDLPADGAAFVDAVNEYVSLVRLTDSLLRDRDEKSSKSLLEKLLEMKYGKGTKTETVRPIICDLPGPNRN